MTLFYPTSLIFQQYLHPEEHKQFRAHTLSVFTEKQGCKCDLRRGSSVWKK